MIPYRTASRGLTPAGRTGLDWPPAAPYRPPASAYGRPRVCLSKEKPRGHAPVFRLLDDFFAGFGDVGIRRRRPRCPACS